MPQKIMMMDRPLHKVLGLNEEQCNKYCSYHERASLSALKAHNTMISPGGAAISLYTLISPLTHNVYTWSMHCECALMQKQ